jgi:peroxiredoxin Q/BCP
MADETTTPVTLTPGTQAPGFSLPGRSGNTVSLSDFAGKSIVLIYFYPKDDTPGCTKEACSLRDHWKDLEAAGVVVLGISRDGAEAHNAFAAKYNLPFELLTDADRVVHKAYGAWGQNPNPVWGIGVLRKSFLVGKDGNILHVFHKVDTSRHAEQVLACLGAPAAPEAAVGDAMKELVEAAKKVAGEVRKTQAVQKAEKAVHKVETAVRKAENAVSHAVAEVREKPSVKKAEKAVLKAVSDTQKKPSVQKAKKAVQKAVADVKSSLRSGVKKVRTAVGMDAKRKPAKKASRPKAAKPVKKSPPKAAAKPVKKVVKKITKKPAKKAVKTVAKKVTSKAKSRVAKKSTPARKGAKPARKR